MNLISTKTHGFLDYGMATILLLSPWIFGFYQGGWETWILIILGIGVILYSLITNYELGLTDGISMKTHLALDFVGGVLLAVSPWLFGFHEVVYWPHLIFGIAEIGAAVFTSRVPSKSAKADRNII